MSQIGTIISITPSIWNQQLNWSVVFTYALDAGGVAQARVVVGQPQTHQSDLGLNGIPGANMAATVAPWASPSSTISVTAPGASGANSPILLPCPPLAQTAIFNLPLK